MQHKRTRKVSSHPLDDATRSFLSQLLEVIMQKMRWNKDEDPTDLDEDDVVAFDGLRKVPGFSYFSSFADLLKRN